MKKILCLILSCIMLLSCCVLPAVAEEKEAEHKYRLAFSDDLDGKLASHMPWWDPNGKLGSSGVSGSVAFTQNKLFLGKNSWVALISASGSEAAADFTEGILQFDVTWGGVEDAASFQIEMGTIDGTRTCDINIRSGAVYIRSGGSLTDSTQKNEFTKAPGFELGKTYRIFVYLNKGASSTDFRMYSSEIKDGKEPEKYTLNAQNTTKDLNGYMGGGCLRFRTGKSTEKETAIDNIKIYVPDDAGTETEISIIPDFYKTETMTEDERREYLGLPSLEEVAKTQRLNGEYYNKVLEDDFSDGMQPWWDPDKKLLGSAGTNGTSAVTDGKLVLQGGSRKSITTVPGYEAAGNFNRGIIEFDATWNHVFNPFTISIYEGSKAVSSVIVYENYLHTTQFGAARNLTMGAEGVTVPNFVPGKQYNFKYYIEKNPELKACLIRLYVAEYKNNKLGKHSLVGGGHICEELFAYGGGGYVRFALNGANAGGSMDIDNFKMYVPTDDNKTADSIHISDIIPDYDEVEARIAADRAVRADDEGIHMLERIGMIIGEGDGVTEKYLKTRPTRVQAAVLTLRLRGLEEEAKAFESSDNFSDIENVGWAKNILAYIKAHPELGMVGVGDNCFDPMAPITQQAYVKILLESLGYKYNEDFSWGEVLSFAKEKGMTFTETAEFNVREVAKTTKSGLYTPMKGQSAKLFAKIIGDREGIVDADYADFSMTDEFRAMKEAAKYKDYGMMFNNDGGDDRMAYTGNGMDKTYEDPNEIPDSFITKEAFYATLFDSLLDPDAAKDKKGIAQVDTIVYNPTINGTLELAIREAEGINSHSQYYYESRWGWRLYEKIGKDNLDLTIDWGKEHDMPVFFSLRMNDNHDTGREESELTKWKRENMEHLIARKAERSTLGFGNKSWGNLDYGHGEARQQVYNVVKHVVQNYDVDGLQFDFFRHLCYFKEVVMGEKVYPESLERMNDLMRAIRKMVDAEGMKRGKAIPIMVKVPDSLSYCYNVGLDIQTWIDEGLIDIASTGGYWSLTNWEESVEYYQTKNSIPFYACLSRDTIGTCRDYETWRNEAAVAWKSGAKGVETFNVLSGSEDVLRFIGEPETAGEPTEGYEKLEFATGSTGRYWPGQWLREGVPFRWTESYPDNWETMNHGERIYNGGEN